MRLSFTRQCSSHCCPRSLCRCQAPPAPASSEDCYGTLFAEDRYRARQQSSACASFSSLLRATMAARCITLWILRRQMAPPASASRIRTNCLQPRYARRSLRPSARALRCTACRFCLHRAPLAVLAVSRRQSQRVAAAEVHRMAEPCPFALVQVCQT